MEVRYCTWPWWSSKKAEAVIDKTNGEKHLKNTRKRKKRCENKGYRMWQGIIKHGRVCWGIAWYTVVMVLYGRTW